MSLTFTVTTEQQLNQAIATIDAATSGSYTIVFSTTIFEGTDTGDAIVFDGTTLSAPADLYALNLAPGVSVTIDGADHALDGAYTYRGLFVYAGAVTIMDLTIQNAHAVGGAAGGGAGLGGGLFVAGPNPTHYQSPTLTTGAQETLDNVTFTNDAATGGRGGASDSSGGGGGGTEGRAGFGGGNGGGDTGGGGGGLGAGGDIFVQQGGVLTIEGGSLGPGTVTRGVGPDDGQDGQAYGGGIFLQGDQTQTLAPGAGETLPISGPIGDENGSVARTTLGAGGLAIDGAGTVILDAAGTYTGGTTIDAGTLVLGAPGVAGAGAITFAGGGPLVLAFATADAPTNVIDGFSDGDTIDITGLEYAQVNRC